MDISKVYDLVALRVIVKNVEDCYRTLGIIHRLWRPLPGRIKDYIALPKPNGYRSLHTTIFTGDGGVVEIQIRTEQMHHEAEYGIASHLFYKEHGKETPGQNIAWVKQLLEWQKNVSHSGEFLENLKMDFFKYRAFVFTPKGDVIDLPDESSPIDFAYAIHSDIGDHVAGAIVNGKLVPLDTKLRNGDIVRIDTKKTATPKSKWLDYAKTTLAKRHIRNYLDANNPFKKFIAGKFKNLISCRFRWKNFLYYRGPPLLSLFLLLNGRQRGPRTEIPVFRRLKEGCLVCGSLVPRRFLHRALARFIFGFDKIYYHFKVAV